MRRAHKKVSNLPPTRLLPDECSAEAAEHAFALLEGRWKLSILYHLFDRGTLRFSDLERLIPEISQRMLSQQLRALERDKLVSRMVYPDVPPRVEYSLTEFGAALRKIVHELLEWAARKPK